MNILTAILRRPSQRTQMEATLVGLSILLLASIVTPIYILFFSDSSLWIKILSSFGSFGMFLLMFSNLSINYVQYSLFKMQMGLYPQDEKVKIKIEEFKRLGEEIKVLIGENENKV